jgi:hypothetical protein
MGHGIGEKQSHVLIVMAQETNQVKRNPRKRSTHMNEETVRKLEHQSSIYQTIGMIVMCIGAVMVFVSLVDEQVDVLTMLSLAIVVYGFFGPFAKSATLGYQAHLMRLQLDHIHRGTCVSSDQVVIIDTQTSQVHIPGIWADSGGFVTSIDSQTTQCAACKSRTIFEHGKPPRYLL